MSLKDQLDGLYSIGVLESIESALFHNVKARIFLSNLNIDELKVFKKALNTKCGS